MSFSRRAALLSATLLLIISGCPVNPDGGVNSDPNNPTASVTGGVTGSVGQQPSDSLSDEFPTCTELNNGEDWRAEILRLVNVERQRAGLGPVTHNQTLEDQATQYACELIHYDFFAHDNPFTGTELRDRAEEFGYEFQVIGENLAAGQSTPAQAMRDWMDSPGHRANILHPDFTELGVGIRTGGTYGIYWVQEFGLPLNN
jgi:uncharacterized protein YkwD